jgi:hypothetical protein
VSSIPYVPPVKLQLLIVVSDQSKPARNNRN